MEPAAAFVAFANGKEHLNLDDLSCALIAVFGFKLKKRHLRGLLARHAPGAPGLGLAAFLALVGEQRRELGARDRAFRLFAALDTSSRGFLDLAGFRDVCATTCAPAAARAGEIFFEMDKSKSGTVTLTDFEAYLAGV
uniref:EF-hand domain-containing protein n=1 Tax=Pyrodinium bahamense TaxID=73915 RepID=A0A7S0A863_9DINO|mmetsp:Transcript_25476/g.70027  ORF Transcript_25476/g.70027 Transcript_25476/m.70027 type:complete len:138 (+) Transcript_25476:56-469(+)